MADPLRKDVSVVRKKIDTLNKELKPLGLSCQRKVKILQLIFLYITLFASGQLLLIEQFH